MDPLRSSAASTEDRRRSELDVYDLLIGLTLATAGRARAGWRVGRHVLRPVVGFALRPPLLPARVQPIAWLQEKALLGRVYRVRAAAWLQEAVPTVADTALESIDLTSIVLKRVDLDKIIDGIDLDAIVARLDLDAVIDRMDLAALAREVIDDIDLPQIIRESTGTITSEAVLGIRMQGIQADDGVSRVVDRVLLRRGPRRTQPRTATGAHDETPR